MKNKTEEMELVATDKTLAPEEKEETLWLSAAMVAKQRQAQRRKTKRAITVYVKHKTPIAYAVMDLLPTIEDVFSATKASAIMARVGACDAVRFEYNNLNRANECISLIESAEKAKQDGKLTVSEVCVLTETGVKMDKYCFSFYVVKN